LIRELKIKMTGQSRVEKACKANNFGIKPIRGGSPLRDKVVERRMFECGVLEVIPPVFIFWTLARKALHIIGAEIIMYDIRYRRPTLGE